MTAKELVPERDVAIVDLAVTHELIDGQCACGQFGGSTSDHRRHIGSFVVIGAQRVMSRVTRAARAAR